MNARDDEEFEQYLRQFKPRTAGSLPSGHQERAGGFNRFAGWAAVVAVLLVTAALAAYFAVRSYESSGVAIEPAAVRPSAVPETLTLGEANALLTNSPSIEEAIDRIAFPSQSTQQSKGTQSALAALSKETIKL